MYKPEFRISPGILKLIIEATELKTWIEQASVDVVWLHRLQLESIARIAHSSTSIEGNSLTFSQVKALAQGSEISAIEKDKIEIGNYFRALQWVWKLKKSFPIKEPQIFRLHHILTQDLLSLDQVGKYKKKQNRIVNEKGFTVYTPPPPNETPKRVAELLLWLKSSEAKELHAIVVSAIVHHQLVSIHPFSDGNGRISRLLGLWILYERGFDTKHLFTLDEFFNENRQTYYLKIQQARDLDDDLTYWIEYVAEGVVSTLKKVKERVHSLKISQKNIKISLTQRQEDFLIFLRDHGRVKSTDFEKEFKMTRSRVNQIIRPLVEQGLVFQEGYTRATTYILAS